MFNPRFARMIVVAVVGCGWLDCVALAQFAASPAAAEDAGLPELADTETTSDSVFIPAPIAYQQATASPVTNKLIQEEQQVAALVRKLLAAYSKAEEGEQKSGLRAKLRTALTAQFDKQRERRELQLAQLDEQIRKLRDTLRKRVEARESIIDRRLEQLAIDAEGLGWQDPAGHAFGWEYSTSGYSDAFPTSSALAPIAVDPTDAPDRPEPAAAPRSGVR